MPVSECISQLKWLHFDRSNPLSDFQTFDDASRGPWGAFRFVWLKKGTPLFASIGCLITVRSIAFEPTAQQVLDFPTRTVQAIGETAIIGVASQFELPWVDIGKKIVLNDIPGRSPTALAPSISLQLAVLAGLTGGTTSLASS